MIAASSRPLRRLAAALVAASLLAVVAPGCSDDATDGGEARTDPSVDGDGAPTGAETDDGQEWPEPEQFSGSVEDFYVPPDPLPAGSPGQPIRVMEAGESDGRMNLRVMYHSLDARDRDRVVTGLVSHPTGPAPADGWPVVATAPGTTGVSAQCAVSRRVSVPPDWGVEGVWVMTDYIGLGPTGDPPHAYLSRLSEGRSVIDAVRAVRNLPEAGAGDRWLSVGHSQGGHGALSAHELAAEHAPELDLIGTLAMAPAAMLDQVYGGADPIVTAVLTAMTLHGGAHEHPTIDIDDYVTPELAAMDVLETGCLAEITEALAPLAASGDLFSADPRDTEPARSLLLANDVGLVAADAPVFLVSGTADALVVIDRVLDLHDRLCETGQVNELLVVDGADHDSVIAETADETARWLQDRLDGEEPVDSCGASPPDEG